MNFTCESCEYCCKRCCKEGKKKHLGRCFYNAVETGAVEINWQNEACVNFILKGTLIKEKCK